ncbi:MAG: CRISPR-associated endonuclease Cas2 [Methylococcales bacterium]|nr:CRISPR-associated endonuclease Cas2 [Methylococcales bacterium]
MSESDNNLSRKRHWLIVYDISDHRQRRLIFNLLKNYGQRVQFSVFECELSKKQQLTLRQQLCDYMETDDSIRWYPLCQWCKPKVDWMGIGEAPQDNDFYLL